MLPVVPEAAPSHFFADFDGLGCFGHFVDFVAIPDSDTEVESVAVGRIIPAAAGATPEKATTTAHAATAAQRIGFMAGLSNSCTEGGITIQCRRESTSKP